MTYIDSSGIGELVSAYTTITNQGGGVTAYRITAKGVGRSSSIIIQEVVIL